MPKPLQSVLTLINGTRDAIKPSIQTFPPLDVEQLAAELSIDERGRKQGAEGKPREDAETPDSEELGIGEEIERRARQAAEEYRESLEPQRKPHPRRDHLLRASRRGRERGRERRQRLQHPRRQRRESLGDVGARGKG